ncbi:MAG: DNA polymerase I [Candidatus Yanofskybacteria bacterium]|nr:DNA polymerase I [Candidatus Yanofskybacteria bacterium]
MTKKLILIDSNALIHRAFHALPALNSPSGIPSNAVYGFTAVLLKMLKDLKPDYIAATFDLAGPTFRHEEFAEYKAHRIKGPDELHLQIPLVRDVLKAFGIPIFEYGGFEADDLIGTLAEQSKKIKDLQVIIVTGDLDTLQLVENDKVIVFTLKRGVTDTVTYNEKEVHNRYGLKPSQLIDFKGLKGDPSDNIPGVPGIGEKTASTLIQSFGNLERLYEEVSNFQFPISKKQQTKIKPPLSEKLIQKLQEHKDMAFFSKKLSTIIRTVPIEFDLKAAQWQEQCDRGALEQKMKDFGFFSLLKRVPEAFGDRQIVRQESMLPPPSAISVSPILASQPKGEFVLDIVDNDALAVATSETQVSLTDPEDIAPLLNSGQLLIGYDLKRLYKFFNARRIKLPNPVFDIQIAAYLLNPDGKEYDFENIFLAHTGISPDQNLRFRPAYIWQLKAILEAKMKNQDLTQVFRTIEMPLVQVLARMEEYGIMVDEKALKKLLVSANKTIAKLEKEIYDCCGTTFNINSPQQLGEVLFNTLGLKGRIRRTGGGALSTAASELEKLRELHPVVPLILEYREIQKLKTTYIEPFPALVDSKGRIHTTYLQTGAATGRLASQNPNLQNIPTQEGLGQEFRKSFTAPKGFQLVSFDYSQLELRLVAHLAKDSKMIETFKRKEDIHTRTAMEIFGVPADKVTKDMRRQAKVLNFGIIYGMGPLAFGRAAGIDRTRAKEFIDRYFEEFQGVAAYMVNMKKFAAKHGYVETLFGRKRPMPDITSSIPQIQAQAERMAINQPVQGTEADLIKLAMIAIDDYLESNNLSKDARMLLQVHDELVFEIRTGRMEELIPKITSIMEEIHSFDVPIVVDSKYGDNWSEMKSLQSK